MSSSITTHLFWGYDLGSMEDESYNDLRPEWLRECDDIGEWESRLAELAGLSDAGYERKRDLVKETGCTIDWYGYLDGDTYPFVCVEASHVWGGSSPRTLSPRDIAPIGTTHVWWAQLHEFMERLELPVQADAPAWHVAASFG